MFLSRVRYADNWLSLAEALDLLYVASAYDKKAMNEYYRKLNEMQFYVNNLELELEETKLLLRQFKTDYYNLLEQQPKEDKSKILVK